jgi:nicotinamidase-related amidase
MHQSHVPDWARERGKSMAAFESIDPARAAVVVVDMQNAFIAEGFPFANPHVYDIIPNINRITRSARRKGMPVYFMRHTFSDEAPQALAPWQLAMPANALTKDLLRPGQPAHAIHAELEVEPSDRLLDKYRFSAMLPVSSPLDRLLRAEGIDTLVVTGTLTNCCCECTARDAAMLSYKVFAVQDAMASLTDEEHNAALLNMTLIVADVRDTASMTRLIDGA